MSTAPLTGRRKWRGGGPSCATAWTLPIEIAVEIAEDDRAARPRTKEEAVGCLMTEHSPPDTDLVYMGILEPLLVVAEEVPYGISRIIEGR